MSQIFTGSRAIVKINGQIVGFAGGVNVTIENAITDVEVMGQLEVGDLAETAHKCNFSLSTFKPIGNDGVLSNGGSAFAIAAQLGIGSAATVAGAVDKSATQDVGGALKPGDISANRQNPFFNCEIIDDIQGNSIFQMVNCKYEGGSGQVDARGVWQGSWNFKAQKGFGI